MKISKTIYLLAENDFKEVSLSNRSEFLKRNILLRKDVQFGEGVVIGNFTRIGRNVVISDNVTIGHNVKIADNVTIGEGTFISDNVTIKENVNIGEWSHIENKAYIKEKVTIEKWGYVKKNDRVEANAIIEGSKESNHPILINYAEYLDAVDNSTPSDGIIMFDDFPSVPLEYLDKNKDKHLQNE